MKSTKFFYKVLLLILSVSIFFSIQVFAASSSKVTGLSAKMEGKEVYLEWDEISGVSGYEIYVYIPRIGYCYVGSVEENNAKIKGFAEGKKYETRVRSYKLEDGKKSYGPFSGTLSFEINNTSPDTEEDNNTVSLDKVEGLKVEKIENRIASISWNEVTGADGYEMYFEIGDITTQTIPIDKKTSGVRVELLPNVNEYTVKVRAFKTVNNEKIYGEYSEAVSFEVEDTEEVVLGKVNNVSVQNLALTYALINWSAVEEAEGYEVFFGIPGTTKGKLLEKESSPMIVSGLVDGEYIIKVRAYKMVNDEKAYGEWSDEVRFVKEPLENTENEDDNEEDTNTDTEETTTLGRVTGLTAKLTGTTLKLNWSAVSGTDGYEIFIETPGNGNYTFYSTMTSHTVTSITHVGHYTVKVRAYKTVNGNKIYGEYSKEVGFEKPEESDV